MSFVLHNQMMTRSDVRVAAYHNDVYELPSHDHIDCFTSAAFTELPVILG